MNHKEKIKTREELKEISFKLKEEGKKIVTTNGSFDILHSGHLFLFKEAKKQGDILIVAINSDKSVKTYKGPNRPIIPEKHRAEMVAALQYVDYVTILGDDEDISCDLVRLTKPNVHCTGSNYGKNCIESPIVKKIGARLHLVDIKPSLSTSEVIKKIHQNI